MSLLLNPDDGRRIRAHGEETYPLECCGILLGREAGGRKTVVEIQELGNEREESRHNRFLISPETLLRADREARSRNLDILGFYHSHPDAPARPSEYDREHAWPTYSYVIVAVSNARATDMTSWTLSGDRLRFEAETVVETVEV